MTQRASDSLVAVLIRIGLLLALAVLLMAENAQAETANHFTRASSAAEKICKRTAAAWKVAGTRTSSGA